MKKHEFIALVSTGDIQVEELWVERRYAVRQRDALFPAVFMTMLDDDRILDTDEDPAIFTDGPRDIRLSELEQKVIRDAIIRFQSQ